MLVCVPLSTMSAWQKEFEQWAPEMNMVVYNGNAAARQIIREYECYDRGGAITFNVLLTNYELVIKDRTFFEEVEWSNIAVDEAHRLKSEESLLYKVLVGIKSHHRLLLTGAETTRINHSQPSVSDADLDSHMIPAGSACIRIRILNGGFRIFGCGQRKKR
jgi:SNF2-related domain